MLRLCIIGPAEHEFVAGADGVWPMTAPSERGRGSLSRGAQPAGHAESTANGERAVLRDGSSVVIRSLVTGDVAAIASWFAGLGAETRYARFFARLERLDSRTQSELARVDHIGREAIAAFAADGTTVGIARYMRTGEPRTAEVAVAVADTWRGKGIAGLLLQRLAARARAAGIERFTALCLASNHTVIRLLSRLGQTIVGPPEAGVVQLRIDLTSPALGQAASQATPGARSK